MPGENRVVRLTLNVEPTFAILVRQASAMERTTVSRYLRGLVLNDLRKRKILTLELIAASQLGSEQGDHDDLVAQTAI